MGLKALALSVMIGVKVPGRCERQKAGWCSTNSEREQERETQRKKGTVNDKLECE